MHTNMFRGCLGRVVKGTWKWTKIWGSGFINLRPSQDFFNPRLQKNQHCTLSQGNSSMHVYGRTLTKLLITHKHCLTLYCTILLLCIKCYFFLPPLKRLKITFWFWPIGWDKTGPLRIKPTQWPPSALGVWMPSQRSYSILRFKLMFWAH